MRVITFAAVGALTGFLVTGAQAETVLTVATAGSENMADYVTDYLGPKFEAANPGVSVRVIGTGPGDAGSTEVMERLEAHMKAGPEADIHRAVAPQTRSAERSGGQEWVRTCKPRGTRTHK